LLTASRRLLASRWVLAPAASPLTGVWLRRIASHWGLVLT